MGCRSRRGKSLSKGLQVCKGLVCSGNSQQPAVAGAGDARLRVCVPSVPIFVGVTFFKIDTNADRTDAALGPWEPRSHPFHQLTSVSPCFMGASVEETLYLILTVALLNSGPTAL